MSNKAQETHENAPLQVPEPKKELPKRLATSIEAYRAANKGGNIKIFPITDSYGNVAISTEQTVREPFTHEESINVVSSITSEMIKAGIEALKKNRDEGDPKNQQEMGVKVLRQRAVDERKRADDDEAAANKREQQFNERIADMEAWLQDAEAVEKAAKEEYQKKIDEDSKAVLARLTQKK